MCGRRKTKKETWHDELNGVFEAGGSQYYAGLLHSAHWTSWRRTNGTWAAKMTSAWDY